MNERPIIAIYSYAPKSVMCTFPDLFGNCMCTSNTFKTKEMARKRRNVHANFGIDIPIVVPQ